MFRLRISANRLHALTFTASFTVLAALITGCWTPSVGGKSTYDPAKGDAGWNKDAPEKIENLAALESETPELADFPDILVPEGFVYDPRQSYVNISFTETGAKYRVAQFYYLGKANVPSVTSFYRDHMATNGWKLNNIMGLHRKTLDFSKTDQATNNKLRIILMPDGRKTELTIHVF
ncbi:MAG: hypothetical protein O3B01_02615 [Planctomycetota bacterium]|nr:hypothetical protein [Planctomycetota bacterium]MDA1137452.1 hypothetical protein [Planctomycetota bacterium]